MSDTLLPAAVWPQAGGITSPGLRHATFSNEANPEDSVLGPRPALRL